MSFRDFTYPAVLAQLGLTNRHQPLFPEPPVAPIGPDLAETLALGVRLYGGAGNEKARSEFLIAPVFIDLQKRFPDRFRVFSGAELTADSDKGLNGVCDFLLTKGLETYYVTDPIVAVAEAKPELISTGFGQCIAGMRAAALVNEQAGHPVPAVYGVSTTGTQWKFLRLTGTVVTIDPAEYFITQPERVLGVLSHIVELATA